MTIRRLLTSSFFFHSHQAAAFQSTLSHSSQTSAVRRLTMSSAGNELKSSNTKSPSYGLVDVDCNLLNEDLISVMDKLSSFDVSDIPPPLKILHHPSTKAEAIISPSSTIEESEKTVHLLRNCTESDRNQILVKTSVGVHPYSAKDDAFTPENVQKLRSLLEDPINNGIISCIGETGLDYEEGFPDKHYQMEWFEFQLDLAFEFNLPIFLHERLAFDDTLKCIDEATKRHGGQACPKIIVHCYTGSFSECVEYIKRGYYLSVSGYILKKGDGSDQVRKCLREGIIPLEKLMIETDAPYMGFVANKDSFFEAEGDAFTQLSSKKRKRLKSIYPNTPSALQMVLEATCKELNIGREQRGEEMISLNQLAASTTSAAKDFFNL